MSNTLTATVTASELQCQRALLRSPAYVPNGMGECPNGIVGGYPLDGNNSVGGASDWPYHTQVVTPSSDQWMEKFGDFLVLGGEGKIYFSTGWSSYKVRASATSADYNCGTVYDSALLSVVLSAPTVYDIVRTLDGRAFTTVATLPAGFTPHKFGAGSATLYLLGDDGLGNLWIYSSADGVTWSAGTNFGDPGTGAFTVIDLLVFDGFVFVTTTYRTGFSTTGSKVHYIADGTETMTEDLDMSGVRAGQLTILDGVLYMGANILTGGAVRLYHRETGAGSWTYYSVAGITSASRLGQIDGRLYIGGVYTFGRITSAFTGVDYLETTPGVVVFFFVNSDILYVKCTGTELHLVKHVTI